MREDFFAGEGRKFLIALTGGMGSGKSTIANLLRKRGMKVLDLDEIGHEALEDDGVKGELRKVFGDEIFDGERINRKKLGRIVFSDRKKLRILNSIVHPKMLDILWRKVKNCPEDIVIVDGAIIIDIGIQDRFDLVVVADVDVETQIQRIIERDNITREEAKRRIEMQISRDERLKHADFVVDTSLSKERIREKVDELIDLIRKKINPKSYHPSEL